MVDHLYLQQVARTWDKNGLQKQLKAAQIESDKAKEVENILKETKKRGKQDKRVATIVETEKKLVLADTEIDGLDNKELNHKLDFHREEEKKLPRAVIDAAETL